MTAEHGLGRTHEPGASRRVLPRRGPDHMILEAGGNPARYRSVPRLLQPLAKPPGLPAQRSDAGSGAPRGAGDPRTAALRPGRGGGYDAGGLVLRGGPRVGKSRDFNVRGSEATSTFPGRMPILLSRLPE